MRVLFLNYEYPPLGGGAANATKYLLAEFAKRNDVEVDLITSSVSGYKIEDFSANVRIHFLDIGKNGDLHYQSQIDLLRYSWKAYWYSKKIMREKKYDICHAFFGIPCGFIAMKLGLPYIVSLRGSDVPFYNERFKLLDVLLFKRLSGKIWRKAKKVVANSSGLRDLAHESHPDVVIEVISNGVDIEEFSPKNIRRFMNDGRLKLISVGRLIPRKGFDTVIFGLKNIQNVKLTIVGEGPEKERLQKLASDLGVDVDFRGAVLHDEIVEEYHKNDVFVLASKNEGMSNAMLEAIASGLPILTTLTGGVEELQNVSKDGFFIFDSEKNLSEIVELLRRKPELLEKSSVSNLSASKDFSWSAGLDAYLALYR